MASGPVPEVRAGRRRGAIARPGGLRRDRSGWLRDTTFVVGGGLVIAMGVAFALGLWWAGAGWEFAGAWLGVALTVGFGAFFVHVGLAERRDRRGLIDRYDPNRPPGPPGPP